MIHSKPTRTMPLPTLLARALAAACLFISVAAASAAKRRVVRVWSHQGQEAENRAVRAIADAFNEAHRESGLRVDLTFFPDFQYTEKLAVAAAARDLPDAFDLDGPLVARFVDAGLLAPLTGGWTPDELADFLPTIITQGTIDGTLYALGAFDSAVVLYYDRAMFERAGVTPPAKRAWTWTEFMEACARLHAAGFEPVAMHMNESADEWYTYAFSPVVWSGGGRLIDDERVRGVLGSAANEVALTGWQDVFRKGFASTDPIDPDPFGNGRTAMDWSGHWMARGHLERKGEQLGAMPLPVLRDPAAPCGSWCWAVSSRSTDAEGARLWVKWITATETGVVPLVRANGAVPARRSAFAAFPEYSSVPYSLFREQLEGSARPRPRTPHYATLTQQFAAALRDIARGADVRARLESAELQIQRVIDRRRRRDAAALTP